MFASLGPSLDEGADGVDRGEPHGGDDETEERFKDGVSDLNTGGLDLRLSGRGQALEGSDITVLVGTRDLALFGGRVDDGVLKANMRLMRWNTSKRKTRNEPQGVR